MWSEDQIIEYIKRNLIEERFNHSLRVRDTAIRLAEIYKEDVEKAKIAALVHDCAKYVKDQDMINICEEHGHNIDEVSRKVPNILHGHAASYIAHDIMEIKNKDILNAIAYHTTGRKNMSTLEKIIYLADYIEPSRNFPVVEEIRKIAYNEDLNKAVLLAFNKSIKYIIDRNQLLHRDTLEARNFMLCTR